MTNGKDSSNDQAFMQKGLDLATRLAVLAIVVISCYKIFSPFLMPVVWGIIIAVALYPLFVKLKKLLGGKNRLAGAVFILISLALVVVPSWILTESLVEGTVKIGQELQDGTFTVQPPPDKVKTWPVVGEKLHAAWSAANQNLEAFLIKVEPQLKSIGSWLIATFTSLGAAILQTIMALVIAGIMMMNSAGGGRLARAICIRLAGDKGDEMVDISAATIQSVVKGVLLIAITQSVLAGIGMYVVNVPLAGLWALLVLVVAVIQLPPALIMIPVALYVFSTNDSTVTSVIFLIYALIVSGADAFLKPLFLGRGVAVPMLVVLIGAIGGMIVAGVIGLFIGAVILAIGYKLFEAWVEDSWPEEVAAIESESKGG
jgi:predicted PurR-regulated permease PerM